MDDEVEYALLFPFVSVLSAGGIFDDAAFTAGFELGILHADLGAAARVTATSLRRTLRTDNVTQADLIAMHHSYRMRAVDSGVEGWSYCIFRRIED
jgi:hypothetical protein